MRTIALSFGSLIIGLFLGLGIHTSIWAQSIGGGGSMLGTQQWIPTVPPLRSDITQAGLKMSNGDQILDGLNCDECTFENVNFVYSGGEFHCKDCTFSGTINFDLRGAAKNTLVALELAKAIAASRVPPVPTPVPPQDFTAKTPIKATWTSQK